MYRLLIWTAVAALAIGSAATAQDNNTPKPPSLSVSGSGMTSAAPDHATVRIGVVAQQEDAAAAQAQVNRLAQAAINAIKNAGIQADDITTLGITLSPVYAPRQPRPNAEPEEPRIVGYRASNTVQVDLDDLEKVGPVIDAAVAAGANNIQDVSFSLRNDTRQRQEALRLAVQEARSKAEAIADALGVRLGSVQQVNESGVSIIRPQAYYARGGAMMAEASTPVEPGQVQVQANVTIEYNLLR